MQRCRKPKLEFVSFPSDASVVLPAECARATDTASSITVQRCKDNSSFGRSSKLNAVGTCYEAAPTVEAACDRSAH